MNQALACPALESAPKLCLHCGAGVPARELSGFCCRGCAAVYALLQERGLQTFYKLRDRAHGDASLLPASSAAEDFSYLDDPEFLTDYAYLNGRQMRFYLEGVHCVACVWLTEKLPEFVSGVESLTLDLSTSVATIRLRNDGRFAEAAREILRLGYRPHPVREGESEELQRKENRKHLIQLGVAGMVSGNIMLLATSLYAGANGQLAELFRWTSFFLFLPVLFYSAIPFYKSAWASLRKKQIAIDVPIVFGLLVGTAASVVNLITGSDHIYFDSIATLIFLLLATRYLLKKVNQNALNSSRLMHFLAPSKARRLVAGSTLYEEVRSDALREGDVFQVLPGECFSADGVIIHGESNVNCALLTGESGPERVSIGSRVNAGTWNQDSPLQVRVVASGASTRLGKILNAMEHGLTSKAPIVSYLDRVGQAFVAAVLVLTCVGFFMGLQESWHEAINRALAVAIIVCPCTFALATPLAMSLAISRAAKRGILVKSSELIERLSHVKTAFFDKTGTLTYGELRIIEWKEYLPGATEALFALESRSAHPIAKAVTRHFSETLKNAPHFEVTGFAERAGHGVSGSINGAFYEVGRLIETQVAIRKDGVLAGELTLSDEIRSDSEAAIRLLKSLGVEPYILSGDLKKTATHAASQLGIDPKSVIAQASPELKSQVLRTHPKSLMVGDGANDAVALASAYASVAVQGGMEMSIRAAGAYSSKPGIMPISSLIIISRETMKVIRRNLAFAVLYNIVGIAAALSGHLNPLFAAVLMPISALTVILSTLLGTAKLREARR